MPPRSDAKVHRLLSTNVAAVTAAAAAAYALSGSIVCVNSATSPSVAASPSACTAA
jgi:hypothetical protein